MADQIIIPPIRQSVEDVKSAQDNGVAQPKTERSWYLYWSRLGDMANQQARMVGYGTHAARPDPATMPDGAIYVETDRGNALYENIKGVWRYVTGTMWGTISPDQRPTDLGPHDAGFTFRGTDYAREYIWTGTAWVDATLVRWGTHASRLALTPSAEIDGQLFVESDRSDVMYQNQGASWHYIGGVMRGTISPDQRPTDLGMNDAGFTFRATDQPLLQYAWNGAAWVQITGANYWVNGTAIVTQTGLNLIGGTNTSISAVNNAAAGRVDVTITAAVGTGGAVTSVFGRTGNVAAVNGDYTAALVTNAVDQTQTYANPAWITSLAWSKITGTPSVSSYQTPWLSDIDASGYRLTTLAASNKDLVFAPNATERMRIIASNGNVGIKTTAPYAELDVVGGDQPSSNSGAGVGGFRLCQDASQGARSIIMGNDNAAGMSWIQAIQAGIAANTLWLQPQGGGVSIGPAGKTAAVILNLLGQMTMQYILNAANDTAAAAAGVPLLGLYHNAGALRIRLV